MLRRTSWQALVILCVGLASPGCQEKSSLVKARHNVVILMLDTLRAQTDPAIVIIGSPAGLGPLADTPMYSTSKAGLHAYTLCLRYHVGEDIRVVEVFPPTVDTPMLSEKKWKKMSAEECARRIIRELERDQEQIWIGESRRFRFLRLVLPPGRLFRVVNDWSPPEVG